MSRERIAAAAERAFFRPASPSIVVAVRTILCSHALWILLSRPDLPDVVAWPREFWAVLDPLLPVRFGIVGLSLSFERALFSLTHLALAAALFGVRPRLSCAAAGGLLYHFAPFEEILAGIPHTFFGGLTVPVLGLLILSFAEVPRRHGPPSPDHRWPVTLIRLLLSLNYFCAGLAKLRFAGPGWFTIENVRNWAIENGSVTAGPWSHAVAASTAACAAIATGTALVEFLFPLAALSRRAALVLVPLAVAGHVGIARTLGISFPSLPLLLVYLDWDWLFARERAASPELAGVAALLQRGGGEFVTRFEGVSMEPAIPSGAEVLVRCGGEVAVGDVAVFAQDENVVVHRVVAVSGNAGWRLTRGDARIVPDAPLLDPRAVIGRVVAVREAPGLQPVPAAPQDGLAGRAVLGASVALLQAHPRGGAWLIGMVLRSRRRALSTAAALRRGPSRRD